jgi:hypothetical protein
MGFTGSLFWSIIRILFILILLSLVLWIPALIIIILFVIIVVCLIEHVHVILITVLFHQVEHHTNTQSTNDEKQSRDQPVKNMRWTHQSPDSRLPHPKSAMSNDCL